uniref:Uncharacterized protein n=1 Tax=Anguilla anguilla TaxID=7936 RepID=A0A0E9SYU9_ANGAN
METITYNSTFKSTQHMSDILKSLS